MRTHEFASYLVVLARLLRRGPNIDLREAHRMNSLFFTVPTSSHRPSRQPQALRKEDIPVALNALLALSTIDKRDWADLIQDLGLPIVIRPRDASRDLLGKVLTLLEKDPHARDALTASVKSKSTRASPELMRALSSLLK